MVVCFGCRRIFGHEHGGHDHSHGHSHSHDVLDEENGFTGSGAVRGKVVFGGVIAARCWRRGEGVVSVVKSGLQREFYVIAQQ